MAKGRKLSPAQIAAGFGGKARKSGHKKARKGGGRKATRGASSKGRTFTVRALDIAAGGVMLEKMNAPAVVARAFAVAQGQMKIGDALVGGAHDVYVASKANWPTLLLVPAGLSLVRQNVPTKTVKVPFIPLRVGA